MTTVSARMMNLIFGPPLCSCFYSVAGFDLRPLYQGSPTLLSEGHISYYSTVREPDILHNAIV